MSATFYELEVTSRLKDKRKLSAFLDGLVRTYKKDVKDISLTYIFCTDKYLHGINQQFLNHDTYTDIITFDLSENKTELTGEIYISTERIAENAATYKRPYLEELHRIIFHGALHLCGFKDKTKAHKTAMTEAEDQCLAQYFNTTA